MLVGGFPMDRGRGTREEDDQPVVAAGMNWRGRQRSRWLSSREIRTGVIVACVLVAFGSFGVGTASADQAEEAVAWAQGHLGQDFDYEECLRFVASAYSAAGINVGSAATAADYWTENPRGYTKHPGNTSPPLGALVFWGPSDVDGYSNPAGHVGIYVGDVPGVGSDEVISTWSWPEPESDPDVHYFSLSARNAAGYPYDGWLAPAGESSPVGEGSFVSYQGNVYRIAGGAPIYVSTWSAFGGPQPTTALTEQQWDSLRQYPADGTGLCGQQADGIGGAFIVAGGAPIYISSFNNVDPNPCWPVDQFTLEHAEGGGPLDHLRQYPEDGTGLCGQQADGIGGAFVVAGGAPIYISSFTNVNPNPCTPVDQFTPEHAGGEGWLGHLRQYPEDGTGLCGQQADGIGGAFVVAGGAPIYITNFNNVDPNPCVPVDQWSLEHAGGEGWLGHLRQYPEDGTGLCGQQAGGGGGAFVVAGGAPMYISSFNNVDPNPCVPVDQVTINDAGGEGWLGHLRSYPENGTFLNTSTGHVYRVAGGAPFAVSSWSIFGGEQPYATVDEWDLENVSNPLAHLTPRPINGTVVEGLPSQTYWAFNEGLRSQVPATAGATTVDDFGLAAFPELQLPGSPGTGAPSTNTPGSGGASPKPGNGVLGLTTSKTKTSSLSIALAKCRKIKKRKKRVACEAAAQRHYEHEVQLAHKRERALAACKDLKSPHKRKACVSAAERRYA
jgi:hypothetical protein